MVLGAVGANVEAESVATIRITVAQWGQRKPVRGVVVEFVESGAGDGPVWGGWSSSC